MSNNSSIQDKNCADAVTILYRNSYGGHVVNFLASSVLAFAFYNEQSHYDKLIWFAFMASLLTCRLLDSCYFTFYLNGTIVESKAAQYKQRFFTLVMATAIIWAIYPFLVFDTLDTLEFTATAIIYAALAGGSVTVLSADKRIARLYSLFMLLPLSILSVMSDEAIMQTLGTMGFVYAAVMFVSATQASKFTSDAISLKNQNVVLLGQVEKEKEAVRESNQKLCEAMDELNKVNEQLEEKVHQRTRQIIKLNKQDSLTGLLNRAAILESLETRIGQSIEHSTGFFLLFVDLNNFKKINDSLGHDAGDKVLRSVAATLLAINQKVAIGRWGGDEFVIVQECEDVASDKTHTSVSSLEKQARDFSQQLMQRIGGIPVPGESDSFLSASIGIALFPTHSINANELIHMADIAMFEQKYNRVATPVMFDSAILHSLNEKEKLKIGLEQALEKRQLRLEFQPIVDIKQQKILSFEALARWKFNDIDVPPAIFIELAEKQGLIVEIGEWVLVQACLSASRWQMQQNAGVSVNISTHQLLHVNFIRSVQHALTVSGLAPEKLNLEITETVFCGDIDQARKALQEVKTLGVTIAIDDFGTGYSSLSQIEQLPVNCIKVDRHFVSNLAANGGVILRATNMMAKEMALQIVAEGVETEHQKQFLQNLGIHALQGFFFSKPLPESAVGDYALTQTLTSSENTVAPELAK
ncbi:EAL domain-containing protein [Planctobacterium marinum]|uniref:Uncharacterized protein n=1 Tax=Planctobacterium marinum TaxID=1631968 RepID=A0AA48HG79_9ALTE|nr:hypothetical protein MACH26_13470 [Planctobacterium marinum]